ncbi:MAG: SDR family oxidoreductase [Christensenellales bacterium]|jgi:NAD(P)-dependent dehydrogenase (short-subunit alcohol dehydrogenase family)
MKLSGKVVLITGASRGIGQAIALMLKDYGLHVYGTSRSAATTPLVSGFEGGFFKMLSMDVLRKESISNAVEAILDTEGRLDVLINCAGIGIAGSLEDMTLEEYNLQMDTNVNGTLAVMRHVLPIMRRQKSGLIINIGSVAGFIGIPFQSAYSSSKAAVALLTEALRLEVAPFGIKACVVEPGDTKTGFTAARVFCKAALNPAYRDTFERSVYAMERAEENGKSPDSVANVVLRLIKRKNPPARVCVGASYKAVRLLKRLLPGALVEAILTQMYLKAKPAPEGWARQRGLE